MIRQTGTGLPPEAASAQLDAHEPQAAAVQSTGIRQFGRSATRTGQHLPFPCAVR